MARSCGRRPGVGFRHRKTMRPFYAGHGVVLMIWFAIPAHNHSPGFDEIKKRYLRIAPSPFFAIMILGCRNRASFSVRFGKDPRQTHGASGEIPGTSLK